MPFNLGKKTFFEFQNFCRQMCGNIDIFCQRFRTHLNLFRQKMWKWFEVGPAHVINPEVVTLYAPPPLPIQLWSSSIPCTQNALQLREKTFFVFQNFCRQMCGNIDIFCQMFRTHLNFVRKKIWKSFEVGPAHAMNPEAVTFYEPTLLPPIPQ